MSTRVITPIVIVDTSSLNPGVITTTNPTIGVAVSVLVV